MIAHAPISAAVRGPGGRRRMSRTASVPASSVAEDDGISVAPCHRRLRELERAGAIRGYRAVIDPEAVGLGFEVLVQVTMDREDHRDETRRRGPPLPHLTA
jgi:DNA-binding Lrp family transcriptional regulator